MNECNDKLKIREVVFVKKGMAMKAFLKYLANKDSKNIQRQIKAGYLKIIKK